MQIEPFLFFICWGYQTVARYSTHGGTTFEPFYLILFTPWLLNDMLQFIFHLIKVLYLCSKTVRKLKNLMARNVIYRAKTAQNCNKYRPDCSQLYSIFYNFHSSFSTTKRRTKSLQMWINSFTLERVNGRENKKIFSSIYLRSTLLHYVVLADPDVLRGTAPNSPHSILSKVKLNILNGKHSISFHSSYPWQI